MALFGYARVSTDKQTNDKFISSLVEAGVPKDNIVEEVISGTKSWKNRKLGELVYSLSQGDRILVPELSRLGRGAGDVLTLRDYLIQKGITVETQKEGYRIGAGMRPADKMVITVMSAVMEMERDYISERTKEGLLHAKAKGKKLGGSRGPMPHRGSHPDKSKILRAIKSGNSIKGTADRYGVSRTAIYNWLKDN